MIKLKSILAENLLRFGIKNLSESDIQRLTEVGPNEPFWKNYMNGTTVGEYAEGIPAVPFLNPATNKQMNYVDSAGKQYPLFIGAAIDADYDTKIPKGGNNLTDSKRFYASVTFFYSTAAGVKDYSDPSPSVAVSSKGVKFFEIKIAQLNSGKFIFVPISFNKQLPQTVSVTEGTTKTTMSQIAQLNVFGQNIPGYTGTLFGTINLALTKMGFAIMPNSIVAAVTV